ncbi:MAG: hypothetical protein QG660_1692 [Pseudomonadota bacterium]|nr:hypothetical protein [Pseudomonadota bacterium]
MPTRKRQRSKAAANRQNGRFGARFFVHRRSTCGRRIWHVSPPPATGDEARPAQQAAITADRHPTFKPSHQNALRRRRRAEYQPENRHWTSFMVRYTLLRKATHHERPITGRAGIPFALSSPHGGPFDGTQDRRIEGLQVLQLPVSGSMLHGRREIAALSGRLTPRPRADKTFASAEMQLTAAAHHYSSPRSQEQPSSLQKPGAKKRAPKRPFCVPC